MMRTLRQRGRRKARGRGCTGPVAAAVLLALAVQRAHAEPLFASPPHFLSLRDRQQVVFFINEPVVGALASHDTDTVEVVVPRAIVDATIRGTTFRDDGGAAVGVTSVALEPGAKGDAAIRITTSTPLGGVHAYSEDDPPRLIVDLLAASVTPGHRITAMETHTPLPSPRATRTPEPAGPTSKPTRSAPAPRVPPSGKASPVPALGALHSTIAVAATDVDTAPGDPPPSLPGVWRRVSGIPFCAPNPQAPAYLIQPDLKALANALANTADGASLPPSAVRRR